MCGITIIRIVFTGKGLPSDLTKLALGQVLLVGVVFIDMLVYVCVNI